MADVGVPVLFGNLVCPLNDCLAGDLDGATTRPAQEVMVVLLGALQIDRLAVFARQDVHLAGVHHESQSPVDRAESDVVPALPQHGMDLLGAPEFAELREQGLDSLALPRRSRRWETRWAGHWFTVVKNRAWPFLTIAVCCVINGSHYQLTVTRAQTDTPDCGETVHCRGRQPGTTASARSTSSRTKHETGTARWGSGRFACAGPQTEVELV
jgi:hypothetical protein